jgi:5'-3' exonuclease
VPGNHYNFVKKLFTTVTEDQGLKAFYTQTLVGDRSDGITGVVGLGPVKAAKVLDPLLPEEYYNACKELYNDDIRYHRNCELLWILRTHKSPGGGIHYWSKDATREESDISSREASAASQHTSVPKNTDTPSKIVPYFGMDE